MKIHHALAAVAAAVILAAIQPHAHAAPSLAQEPARAPAAVDRAPRANLPARLPRPGKIHEIRQTPWPGMYEVRVGSEILYSDAEGNVLISGVLMDARERRNLTEERIEKLLALDLRQIPEKDGFVIVRGNGARKLVVFEDPNCSYCKRFERDLQKIDNVTVYMFLFPILGPDSMEKSRNVWCAKDRGNTWLNWMVHDAPAPKAEGCDSTALSRNVEFGRKYRVTGTPTLFFANGSRFSGAIAAKDLEKLLAAGGR